MLIPREVWNEIIHYDPSIRKSLIIVSKEFYEIVQYHYNLMTTILHNDFHVKYKNVDPLMVSRIILTYNKINNECVKCMWGELALVDYRIRTLINFKSHKCSLCLKIICYIHFEYCGCCRIKVCHDCIKNKPNEIKCVSIIQCCLCKKYYCGKGVKVFNCDTCKLSTCVVCIGKESGTSYQFCISCFENNSNYN